MITTLIFDLSEVLITGLLDIEKPLAIRLRTSPDGLFPAFGGQPLSDLFCGRITEEAYLAQIIEKQPWKVSQQELKSIIRHNFQRRVPGMEPLVRALASNYDLALLSDHAREWITHIQRIHPFLQIFKHQIYSYQLGQTKSDPSTFTRTLDLIRIHPEQCLFIDDWASNIAAAEKAGLRGILFLNADDLSINLSELGVLAGITC